MNAQELIAFLRRVYVWIPKNNLMRQEIEQVIQRLGGRL